VLEPCCEAEGEEQCRATAACGGICRQAADETAPHVPTRASTGQHGVSLEPWTVQHYRARDATDRHTFLRFPKPGVAGSIPAEGATFVLHMATSATPIGVLSAELPPHADILPTGTVGTIRGARLRTGITMTRGRPAGHRTRARTSHGGTRRTRRLGDPLGWRPRESGRTDGAARAASGRGGRPVLRWR
jgi:hypothetical protein